METLNDPQCIKFLGFLTQKRVPKKMHYDQ